jgi:hypothetical protein
MFILTGGKAATALWQKNLRRTLEFSSEFCTIQMVFGGDVSKVV